MYKLIPIVFLTLAMASAQSSADGKFTVEGKVLKLSQVYSYSTKGFFDEKKDDTIVLLTDRPLTDAQVRDSFGLARMAREGKLAFVQETINAAGQIVNFTLGHQAFKAPPSGGSTEHVFEGKLEGKTISGKVHTKGAQTFFGTKYEYEATFKSPLMAKK